MVSEKSIQAAERLVKTYRSISLAEIHAEWNLEKDEMNAIRSRIPVVGRSVAERLTGFSNLDRCPLCRAVDDDCKICIYARSGVYVQKSGLCQTGINFPTYSAIAEAKTPEELYNAFHRRADHIEKILKNIKEKKDADSDQQSYTSS